MNFRKVGCAFGRNRRWKMCEDGSFFDCLDGFFHF